MNAAKSYLRGVQIVLTTVIVSAMVCFGLVRTTPPPPPTSQDLGHHSLPLKSFRLIERSGRTVTDSDLADRVWIASFIFTRCPLSCPRISSVMKSLQNRLDASGVLLVSITVDPDHDTPEVLQDYARKFSASPDHWWFLTGPRPMIHDLVQDGFKLSVVENPTPASNAAGEAIAHSDRLALVDRGRIVGLFDSKDSKVLDELVAQAKRRSTAGWVRKLPAVNASLNALCAIFLVVGWYSIRRALGSPVQADSAATDAASIASPSVRSVLERPQLRRHVVCMSLAVLTSVVFLGFYLVYHFQVGSVPFRGTGPIRPLYFTILLSHTLLATFGVVPLVTITLVRALRGEFSRHSRIASLTFPIWLYVSVTGVLIYLLLYQLPVTIHAHISPF